MPAPWARSDRHSPFYRRPATKPIPAATIHIFCYSFSYSLFRKFEEGGLEVDGKVKGSSFTGRIRIHIQPGGKARPEIGYFRIIRWIFRKGQVVVQGHPDTQTFHRRYREM